MFECVMFPSPSFRLHYNQEIIFKILPLLKIWMHLHIVDLRDLRAAFKTRVAMSLS